MNDSEGNELVIRCAYACTISVTRTDNGITDYGATSIAALATNHMQAVKITLERAFEDFPLSEGWVDHKASAVKFPASFIRESAAALNLLSAMGLDYDEEPLRAVDPDIWGDVNI